MSHLHTPVVRGMTWDEFFAISGVKGMVDALGSPVSFLVTAVQIIMAIVFAFKLVMSIVTYYNAADNPNDQKEAKLKIKNNGLGLAVSIVAGFILQIVMSLFGLQTYFSAWF